MWEWGFWGKPGYGVQIWGLTPLLCLLLVRHRLDPELCALFGVDFSFLFFHFKENLIRYILPRFFGGFKKTRYSLF